METVVLISLLVLVATGQAANILSYNTGDHSHTASGVAGQAVTGSYSYRTPEGRDVTVDYRADDQGYVATSDAIPRQPAVARASPLPVSSYSAVPQLPAVGYSTVPPPPPPYSTPLVYSGLPLYSPVASHIPYSSISPIPYSSRYPLNSFNSIPLGYPIKHITKPTSTSDERSNEVGTRTSDAQQRGYTYSATPLVYRAVPHPLTYSTPFTYSTQYQAPPGLRFAYSTASYMPFY